MRSRLKLKAVRRTLTDAARLNAGLVPGAQVDWVAIVEP